MDFVELLRMARRWWYVPVVALILAVTAAVAWTSVQTPVYEASTKQLFTRQSGGDGGPGDSEDLMQRMLTYAGLAETPAVLEPAAQQFRIRGGGAALAPRVEAENPEGTLILEITVSDSDGARVAPLANAVADSLSASVLKLSGEQGAARSFTVTTVQPATPPAGPVSPSATSNLVIGIVLGLALGVIALLLIYVVEGSPQEKGMAPPISGGRER